MQESHDTNDKKIAEQPTSTTADTTTTAQPSGYHRRRRGVLLIVIIVAVCFIAGLAGARGYEQWQQQSGTAAVTQRPTVSNDGNKVVTQNEQDISSVVSKVSPSVVSVLTTQPASSPYYGATEQDGAGTGIIIGKDGYIITNKHVIDGATTVGVVLADGTAYDNVQVLGTDPLNDVAFLKIAGVSNLPAAELGDSTSVRVGQSVIAIGNSLGQYQNTVTSGIISGTGRPVSAQGSTGSAVENLTDLIQTDAAINPGNSGGPLLNLQGQVIGINTAVAQDAQGIGFTIPIGSTKGLIKEVLAGKGVNRAYLGVNYIAITADVAKHYNLSVKRGAYVYKTDSTAIIAGSPAATAGVKDKDIITKVGDIPVGDRGSVASLVGEYAPGDTIELTVLRGDKTMTLKVTLASYKQ